MFSRLRQTAAIVIKPSQNQPNSITTFPNPELKAPLIAISPASGQGLTPTQESRRRLMEAWKRYPGQPVHNATIPDALDLLKPGKFHSQSRNRPGKPGFDPGDIK